LNERPHRAGTVRVSRMHRKKIFIIATHGAQLLNGAAPDIPISKVKESSIPSLENPQSSDKVS
jgi:hypothetical protein